MTMAYPQCHKDLKLFDTAVELLKKGKKPHEVCQSLKFCDSAEQAMSLKVADLKVLDSSISPSRCTLCKQNSLLLASMVGEPSRLSAFTDEMNSVCRLIPDSKEVRGRRLKLGYWSLRSLVDSLMVHCSFILVHSANCC